MPRYAFRRRMIVEHMVWIEDTNPASAANRVRQGLADDASDDKILSITARRSREDEI